jgi:hypothetical protein
LRRGLPGRGDGGRRSRDIRMVGCLTTRRLRKNEIQSGHSDWARPDRREACIHEKRHDVLKVDVTVAMKMREQAALLRASKVDSQDPTASPENSPDLSGARLARLAWQVVKHQRTQNDIESAIGEGQALGDANPKLSPCAGPGRLSDRPRDHRW